MTGEPRSGANGGSADTAKTGAQMRLDRLIRRAGTIVLWERLWPLFVPVLAVIGGFFAAAWFGLFLLPFEWLRLALLGLFGLAFAWVLIRIPVRLRLPSRDDALRRIETVSRLDHRPITALEDRLADAASGHATKALWAAHLRRMAARLKGLSAGIPSPRVDRLDPLALRALLVLVLVVGYFYAGEERLGRVLAAFQPPGRAEIVATRIDAWVTPPVYTGKAPIFLTGPIAAAGPAQHAVPEGSVLVVRFSGGSGLAVTAQSEGREETVQPVAAGKPEATPDAAPAEHRLELLKDATVTVMRGRDRITAWTFAVEPDRNPEIRALDNPAGLARGAIELVYAIEDDYGVVSAAAEFAQPDDEKAAAGADEPRPLYGAPELSLSLPQARTRNGRGRTIRDLTRHPWAGGTVTMTLIARDEAGQEGRSDRLRFALPQRPFSKPLARALVHERRRLALDANKVGKVTDALDALTLFPDRYMPEKGVYLALRAVRYRLLNAVDDDDLRDVVDLLWEIAIGIEDGDLSFAEQALRDAQQRLMEALERGASDEEIERLMAELRQALNDYFRELAEQAMRNPHMAAPDPNAQIMRPDDFERMLRQMENLAKSGARDAARQMLSEMQRMLENLRTGRMATAPDPQMRQMQEALQELRDMIRRQQDLMDRTFRMAPDQGRQQPGERGGEQPQQNGNQGELGQLQQGQQALQQALQDLLQQLQQGGIDPGRGLGRAEGDMGRAGEELGRGQPGAAVQDQSSAIENLREGAAGLAEELANRQAAQQGRIGAGEDDTDPLGRPQRTRGPQFGESVKVPDEIDAERAREILEEIRRRLSERERFELERNYLERLLDRY